MTAPAITEGNIMVRTSSAYPDAYPSIAAPPAVAYDPFEFYPENPLAVIPEPSVPNADVEFVKRSRAVLVADVVSYSRLMEAAEFETHSRWRTLRVEVCDPSIVSHRGEVVKNTGDGFIAIFESPLDAVRCAAELQEEVAHHESPHPPERRIAFRIGLHWEPIIIDGNDVYGGGVNIAVRLQSAAAAGGVVISDALIQALDDRGSLKLDDLGDLRLKNMSKPVHAFALRLPGVDRALTPGRAIGIAKPPSIAVLPFVNLSARPDDQYFAEGFADDIIITLGNLADLLVVSRGSTMALKVGAVGFADVGEKLGVRYILSGRIRRSAGHVRISVELLDVVSGSVMWAENYDSSMAKIFEVQDEISIKIVSKIAVYIRRSEIQRALRKPPYNLNAYDYLLQAVDLLYRLDFSSFSRARTLLERAREEDPDYAAPYAFSAHWHMFNIAEGWSSDTDADASEVIRLSQCAIARDSCNGLALAIQGHARSMFHRDYDAAIDLFDQALSVSPNSAWAWIFSSCTFGFVGNAAEGIARAERAIRLSPLDQQAFFNLGLLAQNHYLNGTYEDAIRWSRKSLSLNPRFGNALRVLAASLVATGRHDEAQAFSRHHTQVLPRFRVSEYAKRCPFTEPAALLYTERLVAAGIQA